MTGSRTRLSTRRLAFLLQGVCPLPDPLMSYEDWERAVYADLARMSWSELHRERDRVRLRLVLDDAADPWFVARLRAVEEAIRAR